MDDEQQTFDWGVKNRTTIYWMVLDGSIYSREEYIKTIEPGKRKIPVRIGIAFNVGDDVANHVVQLHNTDILSMEKDLLDGMIRWYNRDHDEEKLSQGRKA